MQQIIKMILDWPQVCQFLFFISISALIAWSFTSIILEIIKFFNISLPIIKWGWPQGVSISKDEDEDDSDEKK